MAFIFWRVCTPHLWAVVMFSWSYLWKARIPASQAEAIEVDWYSNGRRKARFIGLFLEYLPNLGKVVHHRKCHHQSTTITFKQQWNFLRKTICLLNCTAEDMCFTWMQIDPSRSRVICPYFHQYWHEPHLWMDFPAVKSNVSQLKHLTLVEFFGFTIDREDGLLSSLVDLLLEKTIVLKSITVKSHENVSWGVMKVPSKRPALKWWNYRRTAISLPRNFSFALIQGRWSKIREFEAAYMYLSSCLPQVNLCTVFAFCFSFTISLNWRGYNKPDNFIINTSWSGKLLKN